VEDESLDAQAWADELAGSRSVRGVSGQSENERRWRANDSPEARHWRFLCMKNASFQIDDVSITSRSTSCALSQRSQPLILSCSATASCSSSLFMLERPEMSASWPARTVAVWSTCRGGVGGVARSRRCAIARARRSLHRRSHRRGRTPYAELAQLLESQNAADARRADILPRRVSRERTTSSSKHELRCN
jgi:hypothetical protein